MGRLTDAGDTVSVARKLELTCYIMQSRGESRRRMHFHFFPSQNTFG